MHRGTQLFVARSEDGIDIENELKPLESVSRVDQHMWDTLWCWWTSSVVWDQMSPDRLLALAVWSTQNTSPRKGGNQHAQLEGEQAGKESKLLYFSSFIWMGEACKWKRQLGPSFEWTTKRKGKKKKSSCNSSYSLPRWFTSAIKGGRGGMGEDQQASGLPDYHLTHEFKMLWNSEVGGFLPGSCAAFLGTKNSPTPKAAHLQNSSAIHIPK